MADDITLNDLLDMDKETFKEYISGFNKKQLSLSEKLINEHTKGLPDFETRLKLSYLSNAKKSLNTLGKTIVKSQEEIKVESKVIPQRPKTQISIEKETKQIKQAPSASKSGGINPSILNYTNTSPQQSEVKKEQKQVDPIKVEVVNAKDVNAKDVDETIKRLESIANNQQYKQSKKESKQKPNSRVKEVSEHDINKLNVRREENENRGKHIDEIAKQNNREIRLSHKKLKHEKDKDESRTFRERFSNETKVKIEKIKSRKVKLSENSKIELNESKNKHSIDKIQEISKANIEKIHAHNSARIEYQKQAKKLYDDKIESKNKTKLEFQHRKENEARKNKIENHLHSIHPALGLAYSFKRNNEDNKQKPSGEASENGGISGGLSAAIGGGTGLGALGAKNVLKKFSGAKGLAKSIPYVGALVGGVIEGIESRSVGKGIATAIGGVSGVAVGSSIGGFLGGLVGSIVPVVGTALGASVGSGLGGLLGGWVGGIVGKKAYNEQMDTSVKQTNSDGVNIAKENIQTKLNNVQPSLKVNKNNNDTLSNTNTGKVGGSKSWRNNNSGNIKYGDYAKSMGATGQDSDGFAIFPDEETGDTARSNLIFNSKNYKNLNLDQAISRYAPSSENATTEYQSDVKKSSGLSGSERMGDLNPEQKKMVLSAMKTHEGYKVGKLLNNDTNDSTKLKQQQSPSLVSSLQDATNQADIANNNSASNPMPVYVQGGSTTGGTSNVSNTTIINAPNTDATIRSYSLNSMRTAQVH